MYALRFKNALPPIVANELEAFLQALKAWIAVDHNEDGTHNQALTEVPIGTMVYWPGDTAPARWVFADGTAYSRTTHRALYAVCRTKFGAGDGSTTFNVPDCRGRFILAKAASGTGNAIGATGGAIDHTHSGGSHTHSISTGGDHSHTVDSHNHSISSSGNHSHTIPATTGVTSGGDTWKLDGTDTGTGGDHNHGGSTGGAGSNTNSAGSHDHSGSTGSASGSTGAANPPFIVGGNVIIMAGV